MIQLRLKELRKKDYKDAIQFAVHGMHFHWYVDSTLLLRLYGRYFWYLELTHATEILAAYDGERLAGVLLCSMSGESKKKRSLWMSIYVKLFDLLQAIFAKGGADVYEKINQEMFAQYCKDHSPDGEILFLAANPQIKGKGIGSFLLKELEKRKPGKTLYLYTDEGCTYPFYEHRGFERMGQRKIVMEIGKKKTQLQCFLYSKTLG